MECHKGFGDFAQLEKAMKPELKPEALPKDYE